jgi:hypothetical protein
MVADHRSDADGCEEIDCETIISGGDAAEVLQATEHMLGVAASIEDGRKAILPVSVALGGMFGIAPFPSTCRGWHRCRNPCRRAGYGTWHLFEQNRSSGAIGYLTPGQQERDGTTIRVGQSMDLRGPPAARSADGLLMFPFAARCASMRLHGRAIDQDLRRRSTGLCECVEYVYPYALRCTADEAIVECFARTINSGASIQRPTNFRTWIMPLMTADHRPAACRAYH